MFYDTSQGDVSQILCVNLPFVGSNILRTIHLGYTSYDIVILLNFFYFLSRGLSQTIMLCNNQNQDHQWVER